MAPGLYCCNERRCDCQVSCRIRADVVSARVCRFTVSVTRSNQQLAVSSIVAIVINGGYCVCSDCWIHAACHHYSTITSRPFSIIFHSATHWQYAGVDCETDVRKKPKVEILYKLICIYTVSQKKQDTKLLPVTSPNINRFSKLFHC